MFSMPQSFGGHRPRTNAYADIGASTATEVDELGIVGASELAMRRALNRAALLPQYLLLDAFPLPDVPMPQRAIIHGDALCISIAAASIVAKVTRDRLMVGEHLNDPRYGFDRHKGYPTPQHIEAVAKFGNSLIHRKSFRPRSLFDTIDARIGVNLLKSGKEARLEE